MNPKNSFRTPEIEINNVDYCELTKGWNRESAEQCFRNVKN
jgi:hypothetical protein